MRVAVVSNMWPSSNNPHYGIFVKKFCDELQKRNIEVVPVYSEKTGGSLLKNLRKYFQLFTKVKATGKNLDIIQIEYAFPTGLLPFFKPSWKKIPHILVFHGSDAFLFEKVKGGKSIYKKIIDRASAIVFPSASTKEFIEKNFDLCEKILKVIPRGIDSSLFRKVDKDFAKEKLGLKDFDVIIISVANFVEVKNQKVIIEALKKLESNKKVACVFVGDGTLRLKCEELARSIKDVSIIFAGRIPPEEVGVYYDASDIFVSASLSEGYGIAVREAMAKGLCIVASNIDAHKEAVEHGISGLLFDPKSPEELAQILNSIVNDDEKREFLSDNARKSEKIWTMEKTVDSYLELYKELVRQD